MKFKKTTKLLSICICAALLMTTSQATNTVRYTAEINSTVDAASADAINLSSDSSIDTGTDSSIDTGTDSSIDTGTDSSIETGTDSSIGTSTDPAIEFEDGNHIADIWLDADSDIPHQRTNYIGEQLSYRIYLGDEVDTSAFRYIQLIFVSPNGKTVKLTSNLSDDKKYFDYYGRYNAIKVSAPAGTYTLDDVLFLDNYNQSLSNLGIDKRAVLNNQNHVVKFTVLDNESTVQVKKAATTAYLPIGKTYLLNAYVDGELQSAEDFNWYTSESNIASIVGDGQLKSISKGYVTVRVVSKTDENVYGFVNLPCYTYITSLKLNYLNNNLKVGNSFTLKAAVNSTATFTDLTWKTSNSSVATVSSKGVVSGKSYGTATITVSANDGSGKKATCLIIVSNMVIVLDPGHGGVDPGATGHGLKERDLNYKIATYLEAELKKYAGLAVYKTHSTFSGSLGLDIRVSRAKGYKADLLVSLHNNAGSSSAKGAEVIISRYTGSTKFNKNTYSLGTKILTELNKLGIKKRTVYSRVTSTSNKYGNGQLQDYYGIIRNGVLMSVPSIIVEHAFVSSSDYLFLNSSAKLKKIALADAKAIVNHYGLVSRTGPVAVKSVSLNAASGRLRVGGTYTLQTKVNPSNATVKSIAWSSSDNAVATVSSSGKITARAAGKTTITAIVDGKYTAACQVTVVKAIPVTSISLTRPSSTLNLNSKMQLKVNIAPSNASDKKYTFSSSNKNIATVDSKGIVVGRRAGNVKISVKSTSGGKVAAVTLTVKKVLVKSIRTNFSSAVMKRGSTKRIAKAISPSNATIKSLAVKSSNKSIASITSYGVIRAHKKGTVTITLTAKDGSRVYKKIKITVR